MKTEIVLTLNDYQAKFIQEAKNKINECRSNEKKVDEVEVIRLILRAGYLPFSNYIERLSRKNKKHLKIIK